MKQSSEMGQRGGDERREGRQMLAFSWETTGVRTRGRQEAPATGRARASNSNNQLLMLFDVFNNMLSTVDM